MSSTRSSTKPSALRTFLTADDRIEKVAAFVAEHFRENVAPLHYKAFLVGVNREACAKYKRALDKLLPPEWTAPVYTENDLRHRQTARSLREYQLSPDREADTRLMFKKERMRIRRSSSSPTNYLRATTRRSSTACISTNPCATTYSCKPSRA